MYNLFLSGGGSNKETYVLDDLFLKSSGSRILYLPVGLKRNFAGYDECVVWFSNMVASHNLTKKISVWIELMNKKSEININNFDAVYIGGATDTLRLHNLFIKHNFYSQLATFIEEGGLIYGGSGGATILGKSINYDQIEKGQQTVAENSANLCMDYSIFTHLDGRNRKMIESSKFGKVIGIPEKGGIRLDTGKRTIGYSGSGKAIVITGMGLREVEDGDCLENI